MRLLVAWGVVLAAWLAFRCWQGGMFDTGLERLFGWTPAATDDEWLREELDRDCYRADQQHLA